MNGYGFGWGMFMLVIWCIVLLIGVFVVLRLIRHHNNYNGSDQKSDPIDIVKVRYDKGC